MLVYLGDEKDSQLSGKNAVLTALKPLCSYRMLSKISSLWD